MDALAGALTDAERFQLLVSAVTDYAIYMLDPAGDISSWNAGAERIKGYRADEIIGRHFSVFYTPEDVQAGAPRLALKIAEAAGSFETEGWRVRKDGTRYWAHVVIDPIRGSDGRLIGFAKITRDLTERKLAQQSLEDSQEEFKALVQSVTDYAIFMLDRSGRVANWNAGAQRIKGYEPSEIIGEHFSRFYTEEDRNAGLPEIALSTAAREGRFEREGWRVRKDGSRFWANVVIDPIRGPDGHVRGFAKVTRDITERRETQMKLQQVREALFQSQKLEAIGKLTGGVAHDFNNLLAAVLGSLELVHKRIGNDPRVGPLLVNAMQAAQRGANLTQHMLAFARRQELKPEPIDVHKLVSAMADLLDRSLGPHFVLAFRFPSDMGMVIVDPNQLEMAILNLAVNARDAMPEGGTITVAAREEALGEGNEAGLREGRYAVLSVIDHGIGMDEETLQRAVEPFFTTKGVGKGTGLGLPMVHGLAEQSGGRFVIESKPGGGTTASLWLPIGEASPVHGDPAVRATRHASTQPLAILVVDDDALVLMNITAMLEDVGHVVTAAHSGQEALAIAKQGQHFDLLITDQGMPGMTGAQLITQVRSMHPTMPVILATGYAELPPDAVPDLTRLTKPFLQSGLIQSVKQAIGAE